MVKSNLQETKIWNSFLKDWGNQYINTKHILSYLNSYPEVLSNIKLTDIHKPDSIDAEHIEWLWLLSRFTHPIDIDFFKPYYVPIQKNSIDYFIDISDEKFPIFEIHYFFYEPYQWYKKYLVEDITELLLAPDTGLDVRMLLSENDKKRWKTVDEFFAERRRLGYAGKIPIEIVQKSEILYKQENSTSITTEIAENYIRISGVSSIIVGLLPFNLKVKLIEITHKYGGKYKLFNEVKNIRDLVFFLRDHGMGGVDSYRIEFESSKDGYIEFYNNSIIISHTNRKIIDEFKNQLSLKGL